MFEVWTKEALILIIFIKVILPYTILILTLYYFIFPWFIQFSHDCNLADKNLTKIKDSLEYTKLHDKYYPQCMFARKE